jgi:carbonic anhydrase
MKKLSHLFENNRQWSVEIRRRNPDFFKRLLGQQEPEYLWIGCSDSRVPANEIVGLAPGELFVHRNVANLVAHSDMNCLSVLQYAIGVLRIKHIIVTGHYGCGGIKAALESRDHGLIDNWLHPVRDAYVRNRAELDALPPEARLNRLCEINVVEQVANVCHTLFVQEAWASGQSLAVHGFIYDLHDGLLKDLRVCIDGPEQVPDIYRLPKT